MKLEKKRSGNAAEVYVTYTFKDLDITEDFLLDWAKQSISTQKYKLW